MITGAPTPTHAGANSGADPGAFPDLWGWVGEGVPPEPKRQGAAGGEGGARGRPAAVPAHRGSSLWTEDARFLSVLVFRSVLQTVTALGKYPGGPGWEGAPASLACGGSPGRPAAGREPGAESPRARIASRPKCPQPGAPRARAQEAGPGRGPGACGASEPEPRSRPSRPRPERAWEMPVLGERALAARRAPRRR